MSSLSGDDSSDTPHNVTFGSGLLVWVAEPLTFSATIDDADYSREEIVLGAVERSSSPNLTGHSAGFDELAPRGFGMGF